MKQVTKSAWLTGTGLLLSLPAAVWIMISLLKYVGHINEPFDRIQPGLERWGITEPLGWNINLLILFGPVIGFFLAIFQVLKLNTQAEKDKFHLQVTIQKKWFPILVAAFTVSLIAGLFVYMLGENCHC